MKKVFLFLLLFLFLPTVFAAPPTSPFQESGTETGAVVLYPKDSYFEFNSSFSYHVHFVNSSGFAVPSDEFSCLGHFYSSQGSHLAELSSVDDSNGWDDYFRLNDTVTGVYQTVPYNIFCNSSQNEAAFVSGEFQITSDSEYKQNDGVGFFAILVLIPIIFGLFLLFGAASLGDEHTVLRIFMFLFAPLTIFVSLHFAMIGVVKYLGLTELMESIGDTTYWLTWLFVLIISYFMIYFIWKMFDYNIKKKKDKMGGIRY